MDHGVHVAMDTMKLMVYEPIRLRVMGSLCGQLDASSTACCKMKPETVHCDIII